ncbi:uncharacterized protein PADG_00955 [Paracoccidioides brasiliensis Pb18]|uniref:Uncharacterized protein n=1 Tax=Paracoccidioides brasiliensis (strain Pb18) TaxID=502780 RepID=C1FYS9_PARBD|nr:uncharacterized protein PADG_00955 [Paracoccidioides brasiliensis Pb18]EEH44666.2 hypothetical protein PADG_00955 [Paracoccidioides brasiliensis Pb18]
MSPLRHNNYESHNVQTKPATNFSDRNHSSLKFHRCFQTNNGKSNTYNQPLTYRGEPGPGLGLEPGDPNIPPTTPIPTHPPLQPHLPRPGLPHPPFRHNRPWLLSQPGPTLEESNSTTLQSLANDLLHHLLTALPIPKIDFALGVSLGAPPPSSPSQQQPTHLNAALRTRPLRPRRPLRRPPRAHTQEHRRHQHRDRADVGAMVCRLLVAPGELCRDAADARTDAHDDMGRVYGVLSGVEG